MIYCEDCSSYECGCPERKENESMRQQLTAMEDKYLVERGMRRLNSGEAESLRQQLAECQAALIEAHELIRLRRNVFVSETYNERCEKALAITEPKP